MTMTFLSSLVHTEKSFRGTEIQAVLPIPKKQATGRFVVGMHSVSFWIRVALHSIPASIKRPYLVTRSSLVGDSSPKASGVSEGPYSIGSSAWAIRTANPLIAGVE